MKTYYITEGRNSRGEPEWNAYSSKFNFLIRNEIIGAWSWKSAEDCVESLKKILQSKKFKTKIVKTVSL